MAIALHNGFDEKVAKRMFIVRLTSALEDWSAFATLLQELVEKNDSESDEKLVSVSGRIWGATVYVRDGESETYVSALCDHKVPDWYLEFAQHEFHRIKDHTMFIIKFEAPPIYDVEMVMDLDSDSLDTIDE